MASGAGAPFSLHCTICYEAFDKEERVPVVLPCGHTFLCEPCSKRLKSCMECRRPLYTTRPRSPASPARPYRHQYSPTLSPHSRNSPTTTSPVPTPPVKDPLPIPKNLVLIALLKAAQEQNLLKEEQEEDKAYESGDDDEQVAAGLSMLCSDYGTYVVREKQGLSVCTAFDPGESRDESSLNSHNKVDAHEKQACNTQSEEDTCENDSVPAANAAAANENSITPVSNQAAWNEDGELHDVPISDEIPGDGSVEVGELQNVAVSTSELSANSLVNDEEKKDVPSIQASSSTAVERLRLSYGQTVQVVDFSAGIARLARGRGYISASSKQLVKIGDALDEACKLEGMLSVIAGKKEALIRRLSELDTAESEMRQRLSEALMEPDDDPFAPAPNSQTMEGDSVQATPSPLSPRDSSLPPPTPPRTPGQDSPAALSTKSLSALAPPDLAAGATESAEFDNFVFSVTAAQNDEHPRPESYPGASINLSSQAGQGAPYFACGEGIIPGLSMPADDGSGASPLYDVRRPRNNSTSRSRTQEIDFRTGLSGHMALSSARAVNHHQRREIRMMGEHRGISNIRRIRERAGSAGGSPQSLGARGTHPSW